MKINENQHMIFQGFGDEPAVHVFLLGFKSSEGPWSRIGTKSAQNDVSTISFCIKKTASETMVFHGLPYPVAANC